MLMVSILFIGALPPRVDRWIDEAEPGEDRRAGEHGCRWRPQGDRAGPQTRPSTVKCRRIRGQMSPELRSNKIGIAVKCGQILHASVIANESSSSVRIASIVWDYRASDCWYPARERCLADPEACGAARGLLEDEFAFYARLWPQLPIVNSSLGLFEYETALPQPEGAGIPDLVEQIKARNRALWNRYVQADRPAQDRSIHVRSTGYTHDGYGQPALNLHPMLVHASPELWDYTLFVTSLGQDGLGLSHRARPCGTPPPAWPSPDRPPHFCVAARGTHKIAIPGGGSANATGTSFAAPYVAAILAELSLRCDLRGPALIKRLLETADRTGTYSDVNTYGAGVVSQQGAENICKP